MPIELICLDADDTLWHNMRHFDVAEQALFAVLEPFAPRPPPVNSSRRWAHVTLPSMAMG
jgi:hypothetical protein